MNIAGKIVHLIFVFLLVAGLTIFFRTAFANLLSLLRARRRLQVRKSKENRSSEMKQLDLLVKTTVNKRLSAELYLIASAVLFTALLATGFRSVGLSYALIAAFVFTTVPYLLMRIRLENIRRKSSYEGESFMAALLSSYRMSFGNIGTAVERLIDDENMPANCKRLLPDIIVNMRTSGDTDVLRDCAAGFAYAINTNWSRMTAYNIGMAAAFGLDISLALENIVSQLKEARAFAEERKRLNSESVRLVIFMIPAAYLGTLLLSVQYLGTNLHTFLHNQFFTPQGFTLISVSLFLFFFNAAVLSAVNNKQFDF